jgi:hypothetical protein
MTHILSVMKASTAVAAAFAALSLLNALPQKIESNDLPNAYRTVEGGTISQKPTSRT